MKCSQAEWCEAEYELQQTSALEVNSARRKEPPQTNAFRVNNARRRNAANKNDITAIQSAIHNYAIATHFYESTPESMISM